MNVYRKYFTNDQLSNLSLDDRKTLRDEETLIGFLLVLLVILTFVLFVLFMALVLWFSKFTIFLLIIFTLPTIVTAVLVMKCLKTYTKIIADLGGRIKAKE
ncbi:hypothetical protein ACTWQB_14740 [Piscibacillus sp. B03]|uniref:hypothetical protein n=1 Tax=Piscibacillus sp. B03 TaxID=3457430 RepID=UPI003FCC9B96